MVEINFKGVEDPQDSIKKSIAYAQKLADSRRKKQKLCGILTSKSMRFIKANYGLPIISSKRDGPGYYKCTYLVYPNQ